MVLLTIMFLKVSRMIPRESDYGMSPIISWMPAATILTIS